MLADTLPYVSLRRRILIRDYDTNVHLQIPLKKHRRILIGHCKLKKLLHSLSQWVSGYLAIDVMKRMKLQSIFLKNCPALALKEQNILPEY